MKKSKNKKDDEGYYGVGGFIAVTLTIAIHYLFISNINLHPTIHATISLFIFFLLCAITSPFLEKIWKKF